MRLVLLSILFVLAGCGGDAYLKAQADAAIADGNARVAEAQARSEEARAVIALSPKADAGGVAAYLVTGQLKNLMGGGQAKAAVKVDRPRDWLDYLEGGSRVFANVVGTATPIFGILETGKTSRAGYARDVAVEQVRQGGESNRIQSVAGIAQAVAAGQRANVYNIGGNGNFGGTQTNDASSHVDSHNVDSHAVDNHQVNNPAPVVCFGTVCK